MARNEKEIEDALFQIQNLEESLRKNAKGILSSTMKKEISTLVKESLKEQDEVDTEETDTEVEDTEVDVDNEVEPGTEEQDVEDTEEMDMEMTPPVEPQDDTIDLTQASDEEVLKVFKAMGDNDGVIVKKDDNMIHLSDTENDTDYLIRLGESEEDIDLSEFEDMNFDSEEEEDMDLMEFEDMNFDSEEEEDIDLMEFEDMNFDSEEEEDMDFGFDDDMEMEMDEQEDDVDLSETIYEIELDDMGSDTHRIAFDESYDEEEEEEFESYMHESKKGFKAKGMGMGSASKFKYDKKPNQDYKPSKMKQGTRGVGMGKAKFEYKEEVNDEGFGKKPHTPKKKMVKKVETKEASRTLGNGKYWGREGLPKPRTAPKHLRKESLEELEMLRAKNEEYRKALDLFRTKLNEVAVFNSNLAYATRLFTEHSTTKQEKINILRRFDNAETLKESKNLYRSIKDELGETTNSTNSTITESIQRTVEKVPTTGSAVNLIESKTYENPQFLRMKDLMTKLK
jgi:hypothetical protein